jgi:hypothetical protein
MEKFSVRFSVLSFLVLASSSSAIAQTTPSLSIRDLRFNGTACRSLDPSAVRVNFDAAQQKIVVLLNRVSTVLQNNVSPAESRKYCSITFKAQTAPGWQFTLSSLYLDGVAQLDRDIDAELTLRSYFTGTTAVFDSTAKVSGPTLTTLKAQRNLSAEEMLWGPCRSERDINLIVNVGMRRTSTLPPTTPPQSTGSVYTRPNSGPRLGLAFQSCSPSGID